MGTVIIFCLLLGIILIIIFISGIEKKYKDEIKLYSDVLKQWETYVIENKIDVPHSLLAKSISLEKYK